MKLAAVFFVFAGASGFAQENVAGRAIEKRIESMDLMHPPKPMVMVRLNPTMNQSAGAGPCSIPLAAASPAPGYSRMRLLTPLETGDGNTVRQLPAPPCK